MLFGVITCLVSVILLGIDGQFVDSATYPKVSGSGDFEAESLSPQRKSKLFTFTPQPAAFGKSIAPNGILMNGLHYSLINQVSYWFKSYANKSP